MFDAVLTFDKPRVFDADALNLLAQSPQRLNAHDVITPHPGEAARLLGIAITEVPVSYTHLDVYKRQLRRIALPSVRCRNSSSSQANSSAKVA